MNVRSRQEHSYTGYSSHSLRYTFTVRHHEYYYCADGHAVCVFAVITDTAAAYFVSNTTKSTFRTIPIDLRSKSHTHKYHYVSSLSPSFSLRHGISATSCYLHSNCAGITFYYATFARTGLTVGLAERSTSFTPSPPLNMRSKILHNHWLPSASIHFPDRSAPTFDLLTCESGHSNCALNPYSYSIRCVSWNNPVSSSNYE